MRRTVLTVCLAVAILLGVLWATGGLDAAERFAAAAQRDIQTALAGAVRALRGGEPGALLALLSVAFGYGVAHAAGPGHGKVLIGGYGVGRRVPVVTLAGIALAASLAQAGVAVLLVYIGVAALGWTRETTLGVGEGVLAPIGYGAIAALGLWMAWRGLRALRQTAPDRDQGHHDHPHDHDASCGHAHGPTLQEVAGLRGWRDTASLIGGIAVRPCSGALFLLVLTWQLGIGAAGIAAAFAMGLGTAVVTVAVAVLAVGAREGALANIGSGRIARALPVLELAAGTVVAAVALSLLRSSL